ncbi:MAG: PilC/PilY family type IV pilus protein [Desulfobacterales bacterium]|nr:PilC/PilY family type IV pilus protein [Desulfobacterales bacterium]
MKMKDTYLMKSACRLYCLICIAFLWVFSSGAFRAEAGCLDLADVPLDALKRAAPSIVMFLLDDSGSMDCDFIAREKGNIFEKDEGVFPKSGDDALTLGILCDASPGMAKMRWKSQWSGYNRLYYNPESNYLPWPRWNVLPGTDPPDWPEAPNADPDRPRSDPVSGSCILDMNETFYDFSEMTTGDIIRAGGVIVDNMDSGFSSFGPWQSEFSGLKHGPNFLNARNPGEYQAIWEVEGLQTGVYDVRMWWVADAGLNSSSVCLEVQNGDETHTGTVNQKSGGGRWELLFSDIPIDGSARVVIRHTVNSSRLHRACADAVALVPVQKESGINIINAHYYVQNSSGLFLVNLNNDFEYFRVTDDGDETIAADELQKLTALEAQAAGIVSGRTFAGERQNFANWYSFYRRGILTAKGAVANIICSMKGVNVGLVSLHKRIAQPALPVKATIGDINYDYTDQLLDILYGLKVGGSTPLRQGLKDIGAYFMGDYLKTGNLPIHTSDESYPFFSAEYGGACEQAFCVIVTDGFWNDDSPDVGNADGDHDTEFDGGKFGDVYSDTLADVAMTCYENDLNRNLENNVSQSAIDGANHQHMVSYGLSFGLQGTIDRDEWRECTAGNCPKWPDPAGGNLEKIDDLFHAAVNGRGEHVSAQSPEELIDALDVLKTDIENRLGTAAGLAANSVQRHVGSMIYQGIYYTDNWSGDLVAFPLDVKTGGIGSAKWRAGLLLDQIEPDDRVIFSYSGGGGIPFRYDSFNERQKMSLDPDSEIARHLVDYLRGDSSLDIAHGGAFRARNSKLGDIVHSAPVCFDYGNSGAVFAGANDGMLHAFDAETGREMFAYVPNLVLDNLSYLANVAYRHIFYVDNTPYVADIGEKVLLVCGLGKGGKGYFCLDVTEVNGLSEADAGAVVKWEYPADSDADLGYAFSRAYIVNTKAAGWVAIFGNGYDSISGRAVLYILNAETGALIKKFDTGAGGCNGMSSPTIIDREFDGYADYVYSGDLMGNLWKFDLTGISTGQWNFSFSDGVNPQPLFTARNSTGDVQPITVSPEVMQSCASGGKGFMVIFGTGRYLGVPDTADTSTQTFYGIWDWQEMWEQALGESVSRKLYLGAFTPERKLSNLSGNYYLDRNGRNVTLLQQEVESETNEWRMLTDHPVHYYDANSKRGVHAGWYFDLPDVRERSIHDPVLNSRISVMISSIPSDAPCDAGGDSVVHQIDACTGGRTPEPKFDANHDRLFDEKDLILSLTPTGQKIDKTVFDAVELGGHLFLPDALGEISDIAVPENPPGMIYWRVIE